MNDVVAARKGRGKQGVSESESLMRREFSQIHLREWAPNVIFSAGFVNGDEDGARF